MSLKRKHDENDKSDRELIEKIRQLESNVLASQNDLNAIVDIFKVANDYQDEPMFVAMSSLTRIYSALMDKGLLKRPKGDGKKEVTAKDQVSNWLRDNYNQYTVFLRDTLGHKKPLMQVAALKLLMTLLEREGKQLSNASSSYEFPNSNYLEVIETILNCETLSRQAVHTFAESYLNSYDDLRLYFYRNAAKLASPDYDPFKKGPSISRQKSYTDDTGVLVQNTFSIMDAIRTPPKADPSEINAFWIGIPDSRPQKITVLEPSAHKKAFSEAWLALMRQPLTPQIYKQILLNMHKRIIPYMSDPKSLMDFLTTSYDSGGPVSLLALNGLFTLIDEYNLNYPQFYTKLYGLFDRNVFHLKYRARFFRLLQIFLGSTHLPAYLVAAFIKRIARLALAAPPSGIVIAIPVIYNLLKAHPSCMPLIHRMLSYNEETGEKEITEDTDPFDADEKDLEKCMAIDSSLWEIETLQNHYYANIATLAKIFNEQFHKPPFQLEDFLDHTYATFFESDTSRRHKKAPAQAVQPPTSLLRPGDALSDFLSY